MKETPRPFLVWQTIAAGRSERPAALQRFDDRRYVVAVDLDRVPAEGLELGPDVAGVHDLLGGPVGLQVVVVDDRGQVGEPKVGGGHRALPALALLTVAVRHQAEDLGRVSRSSSRSARQIPTHIESPWPSEPVETSTPGVRVMSGWP